MFPPLSKRNNKGYASIMSGDSHPSKSMIKTRGAMLAIALSLAISSAMPVFAAGGGAESDPHLVKLEVKFFQHDYAKDDLETRLARLEKFVFGETKTGDAQTRLNNLAATVPNIDAPADTSVASGSGSSSDGGNENVSSTGGAADAPDNHIADREEQITDGSKYPAVTNLERKLLGKDYASEPVVKRLERLETKVFGKPLEISDLSERMDRLKAKTRIDIAQAPPDNTDWADEDDYSGNAGESSINYVQEKRPAKPTYDPDSDPMFNNRGPSRPSYSSAWSGGGGGADADTGSGYSAGGGYGMNPPARKVASALPPYAASGVPRPAPDVVRTPGAAAPPTAMGLSQQVAMLETELFRKTFVNDTIPVRLNRLESTIFPGTRPPSNMSLPERVQKLVAAVPTSSPGSGQPRVAQTPPQTAPDYDSGMPPVAPQRTGGGLSKIINGLGNLLMGGPIGAYPMNSNLVQDPASGMLIDRMTGNVIDPTTGVVVRSGAGMPVTGYGGGYGAYNNGFNNGLSPIGTPYGMNSGMRYGGSSIRFGTGGMGFGTGGMGFGSGMGVGGMGLGGLWP